MTTPPWLTDPILERSRLFPDDDRIFRTLSDALGASWALAREPFFVRARPEHRRKPRQGWKLHLSATPCSAPAVLERALPTLAAGGFEFKVVRSLRHLAVMNAANAPVASSGKFITVYPDDDGRAVELAEALHNATVGLVGPLIRSDRPYRPGSLVHYRYGSFDPSLFRWTPLDTREFVLETPDGDLVPDIRSDRYTPPAWAVDPFNPAPPAREPRTAGDHPRIGDYRLRGAIARSNRGGVYRGLAPDGRAVVIKEARPHIGVDDIGRDVRDRLRHEFAILRDIAPLGIAPAPFDLIEHAAHLFLVQEDLPGRTLRAHIVRSHAVRGRTLDEDAIRALATLLAHAVALIHRQGVVMRDLNPGNIMLGPSGELRLFDFEVAHVLGSGQPWFPGGTISYASPQQESGAEPVLADDVYSFGATLFFAATATDPFFLPDAAGGRTEAEKRSALLALHRTPPRLRDLIDRCLAESPAERPGSEDLSGLIARPVQVAMPRWPEPAPPSHAELSRVLDGVVAYLRASFEPEPGWLWPVTAKGREADPLNVMHGAAGIGLVLCQLVERDPAGTARQLLDQAVERMVDTIARDRNRPAGLYSGMAGTAWFLAEAGRVLGEPRLIDEAVTLLRSLPAESPAPDLFGGTAGLLLAAAKLAAMTGDRTMSERMDAAGRRLTRDLVATPFGPGWVVPKTHTPDRIDKAYPGYAHGTAGIAYALLCAARAGGDASFAEVAIQALDGLVAAGRRAGGRWFWTTSTASALGAPGWLKGAAGIGMALARAYEMTGRAPYREAALGCIELIEPIPVSATLAQVNGLAGIGEFLLDAERFLGYRDARPALERVLSIVYEQRVERGADGYGIFFPDEDGLAGADFGAGCAGVAALLLRTMAATSRIMTLDNVNQHNEPLAPRPAAGHPA